MTEPELPPRVRIAPSPTGDPHVGTAYVALFNRAFAEARGGTFILRIDDTDRVRYQAGAEQAILRALRWLGMRWDEGPDVGGPNAPYRQSERTPIYHAACELLLERRAAYRCFCTPERLAQLRAEQQANKQQPGYDRRCRNLSEAQIAEHLSARQACTVRLSVPLTGSTTFRDELRGEITIENDHIDDQVLMKSDGFPTYHLANVVDDARMGITHVVRAEEWLISAPKHVLLYAGLREPAPRYYHVPLLRNADRSKISKRKNPVSLEWYRAQGYLPEALLNFLALMGWSGHGGEEVFDYELFRDRFQLDAITLGSPVFDLAKLHWLNGVHLRRLTPADLVSRLQTEQFVPAGTSPEVLERLVGLVGERLHLLSDFQTLTTWYYGEVAPDPTALVPRKLQAPDGQRWLAALRERLAAVPTWEDASLDAAIDEVRGSLGLDKPQAYMPLRMALTGLAQSPPLPGVMTVLGRDRVFQRLVAAEALLVGAMG